MLAASLRWAGAALEGDDGPMARSSSQWSTRSVRRQPRSDLGETLQLLQVVVHRMEEQLACASRCELVQLRRTRVGRPTYRDSLRQPRGVGNPVEDRRETFASQLLAVLHCDVNPLANGER